MASVHVSPPWKCLFCRVLGPAFSLGGMLSPGAVGNQASMIATALVQPAEPPRTFTGKAAYREAFDGQRLEIVQLLDVAIADVAAGTMALPRSATRRAVSAYLLIV